MRVNLVTFSIVLSLFAAACGDDDPTVAEIQTDLIKRLCALAYDCQSSFPGSAPDFQQSFGTTEAECPTVIDADFDNAAQLQAALDRGTAIMNVDNVNTCLSGLSSQSCGSFWADGPNLDGPACQNAFMGTIAAGSACVVDEECISQDCNNSQCGQ